MFFNEPFDENHVSALSAVKNRAYTLVDSLLDAGVDINSKDMFGRTLLMLALIQGDLVMANLLLERAADVSQKDIMGNTALTLLAAAPVPPADPNFETTRKGIFAFLNHQGISLDHTNPFGKSLFALAFENGDFRLAEFLLSLGVKTSPDDLNLCLSSLVSHPEAFPSVIDQMHFARILMERGAHINVRDSFGRTPVMLAFSNSNIELATLLVSYGANLEERDNQGHPVFTYMCHLRPTLSYPTSNSEVDNIHDYNKIHALFKQYQNEVCDFNLDEALTLAFDKKNYMMTEILLSAGAKASRDTLDYYLTHISDIPDPALATRYLNTLQQLGANINAADAQNRTPFMQLILRKKFSTANEVLHKGACPFQKDKHGNNAFQLLAKVEPSPNQTVQMQNFEKLFLNLLTQVPKTEKENMLNTLVREALPNQNWTLLKLCIQEGFDCNAPSIREKSLLYWARAWGRYDMLQQMESIHLNLKKQALENQLDMSVSRQSHPLSFKNVISEESLSKDLSTLVDILIKKEKQGSKKAQFHPHIHMLASLQKKGANINATDTKGNTLLMRAVKAGCYGVADILMHLQCDVHKKNKYGFDALSYLVCSSDPVDTQLDLRLSEQEKLYESLLDKKVNLFQSDVFGMGLVEKALLLDNIPMANRLISDGAPVPTTLMQNKFESYCKSDKYCDLLRYLFLLGIGQKIHPAQSPLMTALENGALQNAASFSEYMDMPSTCDTKGQNVLHWIVNAYIQKQTPTELPSPSFDRNAHARLLSSVDTLLDKALQSAVYLEQKNQFGMTPLLWSIHLRAYAIANRLLQKGASLDIADALGNHPLHLLAKAPAPLSEHENLAFVSLIDTLAKNTSELHRKNLLGDTPYDLAKSSENKTVLAYVFENFLHTAFPLVDPAGINPLMVAASVGNIKDMSQLLDKGIDMHQRDASGKSALFYAVMGKHTAAICWLIEHGAEPLIPDKNGYNTVDYAILHGKADAFETLLKRIHARGEKLILHRDSLKILNARSTKADVIANHLPMQGVQEVFPAYRRQHFAKMHVSFYKNSKMPPFTPKMIRPKQRLKPIQSMHIPARSSSFQLSI